MEIIRLFGGFDFSNTPGGGLEPNCYYLSKEQAKQGHNVTVFSYTKKNERIEEFDGIKVVYLKKPPLRRWFTGVKFLNYIKKNKLKADIIHSINPTAFSWLFPFAKKDLNSKFILSIHGSFFAYKKGQAKGLNAIINSIEYSRLCSFLSRGVDKVIALSDIVSDELDSVGISKNKILKISSGVDFELFGKKSPKQKMNEFTILYAGRLVKTKGIKYLISAFNLIKERNVRLLLVGGTKNDNEFFEVGQLIKKLGLEKKIQVIPPQKHNELPFYYNQADVFVLPSLVDSFAKVVLEAMASRVPVIVSKGAGISEIISPGVNGLLVEPRNEKQLADLIQKLIDDPALRENLSKNGFESVKNFDWKNIAAKYSETFKKIL